MSSHLRGRVLVPAALLLSLGAPGVAGAASAPSVTTGGAVNITQTSATVRATVNPNDVQTRYGFEYGTTKRYGQGMPPVAIGKGTRPRTVSANLAGLAPGTTYHYRIVASSGAGTSRGADRTFTTRKQPLGLSLAALPNPVPWGGPTTLAGTLSGTDNAGRQVLLQQNAFPFTAGFTPVGNPQVTGPSGTFAFPILSLGITTQYRAEVPGRNVSSPIVTAFAAIRVRTGVTSTRVRRGRIVRFAGTVTPRREGALVSVQRLAGDRWVTVGATIARRYRADRSRYGVRVRIRRGGSYRVLVRTRSGDVTDNVGRTVRIRSFR